MSLLSCLRDWLFSRDPYYQLLAPYTRASAADRDEREQQEAVRQRLNVVEKKLQQIARIHEGAGRSS